MDVIQTYTSLTLDQMKKVTKLITEYMSFTVISEDTVAITFDQTEAICTHGDTVHQDFNTTTTGIMCDMCHKYMPVPGDDTEDVLKHIFSQHMDLIKEDTSQTPMNDICNECGRPVTFGSGLYVNRIPSFDDHATQIEMGKPFPDGRFMCIECDEKFEKERQQE